MQTIRKIDAARRQLDVAIRLWLDEDDLAAVQTLAWAGLTVLRDLAKAAGFPVPGPTKLPFELDREAANFLKHANRDPDAWLFEIDPIIPELAFHEANRLFSLLGGELTKEMVVAQRVIDLKFGFYLCPDRRAEQRREEQEERERRLEFLDDDEREKELREIEMDKRCRQSALLALGRNLLTGESPFPNLKSA